MKEEVKTTVEETEQAEEVLYCEHCGCIIDHEDYSEVDGEIICADCVERYYCTCDHCGTLLLVEDCYADDDHCLCENCYEQYYTRCDNCDRIIRNEDANAYDGADYCDDCYNDRCCAIHPYSYKPNPIFYGAGNRYFGVELELDVGGQETDNAEEILNLGNHADDCIYIKSDGSLNDGMELVTHPMTLEFHENYSWKKLLQKCIDLGYRSHQTSTCGLHIHVNRDSLGENRERQEETISRILYFVEQHWNEMLSFSRRSEVAMNRWAARYGYESTPKKILDKAKESYGRYSAINLCNHATIEFRLFRGTLKYNTLIATLQMVNRICEVAFSCSDEEMQHLSWSTFVTAITEPELIQYLKERRLYVNEEITPEEEL